MGINVHHAAIDRAPSGNNTVTRWALCFHAEIHTTMGDKHIEFFKRPIIQQQVDPLACGQLTLCVLGRDAALASTKAGIGAAAFKLLSSFRWR